MKKGLITVIAIIIVGIGAGVFFATKNSKASNDSSPPASAVATNTPTTSSSTKLTGNAEVQAVLAKVKSNIPTVTAMRVYTESTDPNNELGKQDQYKYAGSFYDTAANPPDTATDNYSTSDGGSIEIYANSTDATERGNYLAQFQSGAIQAGAYKVVGNVVLRVSENYTASQQSHLLTLMESAL
ncbi:MAG TPA: hypothetical protein VFP35_00230 [Candidatus Saccharimonadales bacterium]|nr:hypothetical protein [Candidatus Saccharimonadales bacterium]